jgi:hypothetical protein
LTEEKARVSFQDSAIIGDVTVTQNNAECPSCSASNAIVLMKCQETHCENKFCNLCHPKCRYSEGSFLRFDSGEGLGPFCKECGTIIFAAWKESQESQERERQKIEAQEREEREKQKRIEFAAWKERQESQERERQESQERESQERERQKRIEIERQKIEDQEREERERQKRIEIERQKIEGQYLRKERERQKRIEIERQKIEEVIRYEEAITRYKKRDTAKIKVYKKRLMYSLIVALLLGITMKFSHFANELMILISFCLLYSLYLLTRIIIRWWYWAKRLKRLSQDSIVPITLWWGYGGKLTRIGCWLLLIFFGVLQVVGFAYSDSWGAFVGGGSCCMLIIIWPTISYHLDF